ncbi:lipopolysaccharide heptosyltransferase RfaC [Mannheimia massilioguelmaensis]|uniref:lipopolysaccharide heptosyltransferase RfaC n=1 Tax=Mannheimia massilioguelmaensis TaxID=1604354 RepID=UPI0005C9F2D9|nr:lipopolysaccharide heptosyltransferase RfaC [Mannheimia massilioguelmaensis]
MKVLIVKTSSMGDLLHTLPALTDAQQAYPDIQFDWVEEENFVEIPHWHPAVKNVIPVAIRRWRKHPFSSENRCQWKDYRRLLQSTEYDAVIDAQGLFKSAFLVTRLAKGKKFGYHFYCAREAVASFFYDQKFIIPYQQHAVERIRQLFAKSLNYRLPQTQANYGLIQRFDDTSSLPYVIFIHATTRADKHWFVQEWISLANKLMLSYPSLRIYLPWNNETERARAEQIKSAVSNCEILPKLSLTELAKFIAQAKAVVSVDTGLAHLTAALNKPNITLYGATDPLLVGTYGLHQYHIQQQNMAAIKAEMVFQQLKNIIDSD